MQHLDEGTIHAWIDGELPADEAARVEAHAKSCQSCSAMVAEARGLVAASSRIVSALDATPGGVLPAFGARKAPRRWMTAKVSTAIAATLVIAAGTVVTMRGRVDMPPQTPTAAVPHDSVTYAPAVQPGPSPSEAGRPVDHAPSPTVAQRRENRAGRVAAETSEPKVAIPAAAAPIPASSAVADAQIRAPVTASAPPSAVTAARDSIGKVALAVVQMDTAAFGRSPGLTSKVAGALNSAAGAAGAISATRMSVQRTAASERAMAAFAPLPGYVGCYEVNESTDVLPKRFALRSDSGRAPPDALYEVRYVDSTGAVAGRIADIGWRVTSGRATIETVARDEILGIRRVGQDFFAAQSVLGPRTVRMTPCHLP